MFDHNCTHVVCYRVIVAPYVRSLGHVFAYLYTLDDDLEHPMDYETSLLSKVFPLLQIALLTYIFKKNLLFISYLISLDIRIYQKKCVSVI